MVIKASAATEIRGLVQALCNRDAITREAAIARLAVIGRRAVDRLLTTLASTSDADSRAAILRVLESIGDHRTFPAARLALRDGGDVAVAAAGVLRALLDSLHGRVAADALDALVTVALDARVERSVRQAAFEALDGMPEVRERIARELGSDHEGSQGSTARGAALETDAIWQNALEGRLPDDPEPLRGAVTIHGRLAPLGTLQKLIDEIRRRESDSPGARRREEWRSVRGAVHQALAARGSRVALYDLRESLSESGSLLPVSFLAALQAVGDSSCLEPIAAMLAGARTEHEWWNHQLTEVFRTIAKREKITRRHALMRRISARWPQIPARVFSKAGPPSSS